MTDKPNLADARRVTEAATEGPWSNFGHVLAHNFGPGDCAGCSGMLTPRHEPSCGWEQIGDVAEADAKFIAASRTLVPALLAAVDAVLAVHRVTSCCPNAHHDVPGTLCPECFAMCEHDIQDWPCPTVRAITAHLDIEPR